tara:strand:+ start:2531 stop:2971 length:441 start_codon:yes stop_codon:yes gene_type:complete
MKKSLMSLLKNKYVYYATVLFSVVNVLGYFSVRSWECIVMFAAVAYSANCYSKNATVALLSGLFVSNFVFGCNRVKEGFEMNNVEGLLERAESMLEKVQNIKPEGFGKGTQGGEKVEDAKEAIGEAKEECKEMEKWDEKHKKCVPK